MSTRAWAMLTIALAILILALALILFATPAHAPTTTSQATTTTLSTLPSPTASSTASGAPLDTQVTVTSPGTNATVSHQFEVAGTAPGAWFFEAVFPIQVRDPNDDLIANAQGEAQGNWETTGLVTFTAQVTIDASYEGPATLILLKDDPSGLPQNADEMTIPIIVQ